VDEENDFYYAKIQAFSQDTLRTISSQKLSSPQIEADTFAPELSLF
jgi:hypothetical protein